ncbi:MAG: glycosyltransferase family 4 protein [Verrucomicrobiota bacterium]
MRLVFYANCLGRGGAHQSMLAWFDVLKSDPAVELVILCAERGWFSDQLDQRGLRYELLPMPRALGGIKHGQWKHRWRTAVQVLSMGAGLLRAWSRVVWLRADGVVLTGGRDFIMLLPLALRRRSNTVTIPQTTDWAEIPVCRTMCRVASRTYAISASVAQSIEAMGIASTKISVQPLIYTVDHRGRLFEGQEARLHCGLPMDGPIIGMTGLIRPHKGQREAILILREVLKQVPAARLVVVGTAGESDEARRYEREIVELAAGPGLSGRVVFLGWRDDVPQLMRAMNLMLVPSHDFEGVPRVILEGLEAGLPIVATDLPQFREVLGQFGAGALFPIDQPGKWTDEIVALLRTPARLEAAARHARAVWQANYSAEGAGPRIRQAFRDVALL